jgi:cytochrome c-type biogenesis protein
VKWGPWAALGVLLLAAGGAAWWIEAAPRASQAPDFSLTSTGFEHGVEGAPVPFRLIDFRGKVVVLDFMAVNCATCPALTRNVLVPLQAAHANDTQLQILSIDVWTGPGQVGETRDALVQLQRDGGASWRHALDTDGVYQKYGTAILWQLTIVDAAGQIIYSTSAPSEPSLASVEAVLATAEAGAAAASSVPQYGLAALALVAGAAAFFSPCSVGMIPAYLALLLDVGQTPSSDANPPGRGGRGLRGGLAAAAGMVGIYALLALALLAFGNAIRPGVRFMGPAVGAVLILMGILTLAGMDWSRLTRQFAASSDPRKGFLAFGAAYGVASFGCTGPLFLPILFGGFLAGPAMGLAVFSLYAASVAAFLLAAALLVEAGQSGRLRRLLSPTPIIHRLSAVVMVATGAYLLAFDLHAFGYL